jgi:hypothetical protein
MTKFNFFIEITFNLITDPNYFYLFFYLLFILILVLRRYEDQLASLFSEEQVFSQGIYVVFFVWCNYY